MDDARMSSYQAAKIKVMQSVPYIKKEYSANLRYSYASEQDVLEKLRPAMLENGFTSHPVATTLVHIGGYTTSKGTNQQHCVIQTTFRFEHISGGFEDVAVYGEAADTADKAMGKAMTMSQKYALFQWALIERGDDPDKIRAERDSAVGETFKRAMMAIKAAQSEKELAEKQALFRAPQAGFTTKQLEHLDALAADRRNEIRR